MRSIKRKFARKAKRAGLLTSGVILCLVGLVFATVSAWFALLSVFELPIAALVMAGFYFGLGLICIGLSLGSSEPKVEQDIKASANDEAAPPIMQAFMQGMKAGAQANQTRH